MVEAQLAEIVDILEARGARVGHRGRPRMDTFEEWPAPALAPEIGKEWLRNA